MRYTIATILFSLIAATLSAKQPISNFENFGTPEGLSNNTATSIIVDNQGFLWIGTLNGLNRYDGTNFKIFERTIGKRNSLCGNEIKSLHIDSLNNMWIGTATGLSLYHSQTESFTHFIHNPHDKTSLSNNNISKITGSGSYIWVATSNGLNKIDIESKKIERLYTSEIGGASDEIQDICEEGSEGLWIGCFGKGIDYYNYLSSSIIHYGSQQKGAYYIPNDNVSSILCIGQGKLLAGYDSGDLFYIDRNNKTNTASTSINYSQYNSKIISIYDGHDKILICTDQYGLFSLEKDGIHTLNNSLRNTPMINSKIWCIYEGNDSILWVGHYRGGVTKIDQHYSSRICSYEIDNTNPQAQMVSSVIAINDDTIWVGTDGGGIYELNKESGIISPKLIDSEKIKSALCITSGAGYVWIGTYNNGLIRCDKSGENAINYLPNTLHPDAGPSGRDIRDILVQDSLVWFCDHGNYLNKLNVKTEKFTHYVLDFVHPELGEVFPSPWCIDEFDSSRLAIGTNRGLLLFNKKTTDFTHFTEQTELKDGLSSPLVRTLTKYSSDTLLIGTEHGLDILTVRSMQISHLQNRLLPSNNICGITRDMTGNLWVTTKAGIAKINLSENNAQWFDESDGIHTNDFVENSICNSADGKILCGTSKGLVVINTNSVPMNDRLPRLVFTELSLDYNVVRISDSTILNQSINSINSLSVPYWHRTIGISFSSLSYIQRHKNRYSYMLEGFDNEWRPYSAETSVTYSNLDPGKYVFFVKTKNNDGYESLPRRLEIIITPPFYKTAWFIILSTMLFFIALYIAYKIRTSQIRTKNQFLKQHNYLLSKEIVERKKVEQKLTEAKETAESANRAKTEFLANMSHEIRTPLNAVHGFCEVIGQTELSPVQHKYINSISIASDSLLTLINDLLDLSKIDAGQLEIHNSTLHIACLTGDLEQMFEYMIRKKGLNFSVFIQENVPSNISIDIIRLRQILVNLLGNAIKFTHEGSVCLRITSTKINETKFSLKIEVEDTGIGINQDNLSKIFEAFSQIESSSTRRYEGTGLGLAICKKMAELMGGNITVNSTVGKGSTFTFLLPNASIANVSDVFQKDINRLTTKSERKTAIIISSEVDYLDKLSELLIEQSYDVTVFSSDELEYLLSLPTQKVTIFVFNPTEKELSFDLNNHIVIINTKGNDYSARKQQTISPPFTIKSMQALLTLDQGSKCAKQNSFNKLSKEDKSFLDKWLADAVIQSDVIDFDAVSIAASRLAKKGNESNNNFLMHSATELQTAIESFDLTEIESIIKRLNNYFIHNEADGRI